MAASASLKDLRMTFEAAASIVGSGADSEAAKSADMVLQRKRTLRMQREGQALNEKRAFGEAVEALSALWSLQVRQPSPRH